MCIRDRVFDQLEPKTKLYYQEFLRCGTCGKVYWEGSHVDDMRQRYVQPVRTADRARFSDGAEG